MDPLVTSLQVQTAGPAAQRTIISFCDAYNTVPLTPEQAEFLSTNPLFARYMRAAIRHYSTPDHTYELGRSILGRDFITPQEVMRAHRSLIYTDAQLAVLHESRPNQPILEDCKKDNFVIMPAPPSAMSLHDVNVVQPSYFGPKGPETYYNAAFISNERIPFGWMAIKRIPAGNTTVKHWSEQIRYLSCTERVPRAVEMAWLMITYARIHGVMPFTGDFVLTSSQFESDCRVAMAYQPADKYIQVQPHSGIRGHTDRWPITSMREISMISPPPRAA